MRHLAHPLFAAFALTACDAEIILAPHDETESDPEPDPPIVDEETEPTEWTVFSDFGMIGPRDVLFPGDGSTIVFGYALQNESPACGFERLDAEGSSVETVLHQTTAAGIPLGGAQAATIGPNGELVLLCLATDLEGNQASWLGWYDAEGEFITETEVPGFVGYDLVHAFDAEEVILVGADHRQPELGVLAAYQHVSMFGPTDWWLAEGSSSPENESLALNIARHPDGWTAVTKFELDPSGNVVASKLVKLGVATIAEWAGEPCGPLVAVGIDGSIYTAGSAVDGSSATVCRHTRDDGGVWSTEFIDAEMPDVTWVGLSGIATDAVGNVVVSGFAYPTDTSVSAEMFASLYGPGGGLLWHDAYRGEDGKFAFGMAVGADGERIVQAGVVTGSTEFLYRTVVRALVPPTR